jgi:PAS domain S-box-containing protein
MQIGIKTKIFLGFFLISLLIPLSGFFYWFFLQQLISPIQKDIPSSINNLGLQTKLDSLAQLIMYYDETLTQSARNYAFTGDKKWKDRYYQDAPALDDIIKEAILLGDDQDRQYFSSVDESNIALIKMEEDSMQLVEAGDKAGAVKILESKNYWDQKAVYKKGIEDYAKYRGELFREASQASTDLMLSAQKQAQGILNYVIGAILLVTIFGFLISLVAGFILSRFVEGDLEKYKLFYNSSKDALMTLEPPDWKFTSCNPATVKLFGVKSEKEFIALGPWDVSPEKQPDGRISTEKAKENIAKAMQEQSNYFEWTHKKYKGDNFFATVLLSKMQYGGKTIMLASVRDVSAEEEAKNNIKNKSTQLEDLNKHMVGRELKMVELKKKIAELESDIKK